MQGIGADLFEPNDMSNIAANLVPYQTASIFGPGNDTYGPFPGLTTARHPSGLFDYDWYRLIPRRPIS